MSVNPPPPPVNDGSACPNCGSFRPADQVYCANCGYGRPMTGSSGSPTAQIVWIVLFILIGLPAGCLGGCFLLIQGSSGAGDLGSWIFGLAGAAIFLGTLIMIFFSRRK